MNEAVQTKQKPFWQRLLTKSFRAFAYLLLVSTIAGVLWIAWVNHQGEKAAQRALERLEASDVLQEMETSKPIPADENGAQYFRAAMALCELSEEQRLPMPVHGHGYWPRFGEGYSFDQANLIAQAVDDRSELFALVERAVSYEKVDYEMRWSYPLETFEEIHQGRQLGRWLYLKSHHGASRGSASEAYMPLSWLLRFSESYSKEEQPFFGLMHGGLDFMYVEALEQMLSRVQLNQGELSKVSNDLKGRLASENLMQGLQFELRDLKFALQMPNWFYAEDHLRLTANTLYAFRTESRDDWKLDFSSDPSPIRFSNRAKVAYQFLRIGEAQLKIARMTNDLLDFYEQMSGQAVSAELMRQIDLGVNEEGSRDYTYTIGYKNAIRVKRQGKALMKVAWVAMQVEKFRVENDRWPAQLDEVFDQVPEDIYGQAIRLVPYPDGIRIYSIGGNRKDESDGPPRDHWPLKMGDDDWSFRLLDPRYRNRAPTITTIEPPEDDYWSSDEEHASEPEGELPGPVYDADELFQEFEEDAKSSKGDKPATE